MRKLQLILPILLISSFLIFGAQIRVTKINCFTQYGPCPEEYEEKLKNFISKPLISVSDTEIKTKLSAVGEIREVGVLKHFTGRLEVVVEVEKPRVVVQAGDDTTKLWLVTLGGNIVGQANNSSLPKVIVRSGRISPEDTTFVSAIKLTELTARARKIDYTELTEQDLLVYTDGIQAILPVTGRDPQVLVGSLQLILAQGTIEGKRPVKIDLRFKNAVVTY